LRIADFEMAEFWDFFARISLYKYKIPAQQRSGTEKKRHYPGRR
jgi:hypothetical protein